ncbi:MAG: hypothetical protein H6741_20465 [Alphaproteobacteria bacterium]|nr:hypothetical protein [Alphaproteobacteria bacterium]
MTLRSLRAALLVSLGLSLACGMGKDEELEGDDAGECSDEADNDVNGLFDCDDPGCAGSPACREDGDPGDPDDTGNTGGGNPDAGVYDGEIGWDLPDVGAAVCQGEITIVVEEGGVFYGDTSCTGNLSGQPVSFPVSVDGDVTEDGSLSGFIEFEMIEFGDSGFGTYVHVVELEGEVGGGLLDARFETTVQVGNETALVGWIEGQR